VSVFPAGLNASTVLDCVKHTRARENIAEKSSGRFCCFPIQQGNALLLFLLSRLRGHKTEKESRRRARKKRQPPRLSQYQYWRSGSTKKETATDRCRDKQNHFTLGCWDSKTKERKNTHFFCTKRYSDTSHYQHKGSKPQLSAQREAIKMKAIDFLHKYC
jgi:hypothetical protein